MKIKSLTICGFRGFSKETFFQFNDAKIILLYGPNGHGKTSVFDAIEWGLTGEIHRFHLATDERNRTRFIRNLHIDQNQETYVEIELVTRENGKIYKVKRICTARNQDSTDYGKHSLEILLPEILNGRLIYKDEDAEKILKVLLVENAWREKVDASRGLHLTHILGQEKLNEFLRGMKDGDRYDSLSLLFGTEHFIKYREIYTELNKKISEHSLQIDGQISEEKRKQEELIKSIGQLREKVYDPNQKSLNQILEEYKENFIVPIDLFESEDWNALALLIEKDSEILKLKRYELENTERRLKDLEEIQDTWLQDKASIKLESSRAERLRASLNDYNNLKLLSSLISRYEQYFEFNESINTKKKEIEDNKQSIEMIKGSLSISGTFEKVVSELLVELKEKNPQIIQTGLSIEYDNLEVKVKTTELLELIISSQNSFSNLSDIHARTNRAMDILEKTMLTLRGLDQKHKDLLSSLSDYLSVKDEISNCPACGTIGITKTYLNQRIEYQQTQINEDLPALEKELRVLKDEFEREKQQLLELSVSIERTYTEVNKILKSVAEVAGNKKDHITKLEKEQENLRAQVELRQVFLQEYYEDLLKTGLGISFEKEELINLDRELNTKLIALTTEEKANLPQEIESIEGKIRKIQTSIYGFLSKLMLAGAPPQAKQWSTREVETYIQQARETINENIEKLSNLELIVIKSINAIENAKEEMLLKTRQEELVVQQKHLDALAQQKKAINDDQVTIKDLINNVKPAVDRLNDKMVSELFDTIQKVFSRINSHPVYRKIDFSKEYRHKAYRLLIYVLTGYEENDTQANATYIFSSAQINSIALSFFMAMGVHQRWSKLQIMGMDDPIQSMDEINVLSLIDLVRVYMEKYDKQFIISTHDYNFYQMMLRKYRNQEIAIVEYEGYSEKGPLIKQQVNEKTGQMDNVLIMSAEEPISLSRLMELNDETL